MSKKKEYFAPDLYICKLSATDICADSLILNDTPYSDGIDNLDPTYEWQ